MFAKLTKAQQKAGKTYRSGVDSAYEPIRETVQLLESTDKLAELEATIVAISNNAATAKPDDTIDAIKDVTRKIRAAKGNSKIASRLSKARRLVKKGKLDDPKLAKHFDDALKELRKDLGWRQKASTSVLPGLKTYEAAIRDTIGLRLQPKLPRKQALEIAGCNAVHRDISLSF